MVLKSDLNTGFEHELEDGFEGEGHKPCWHEIEVHGHKTKTCCICIQVDLDGHGE